MRLFMKPFLLTGITEHGTIPNYRDDPQLQCQGSINNKSVVFVRAPEPKLSYRVNFEWEGKWYFVDNYPDLYRLVQTAENGSPFLDFYIE